MKKSLQIRKKLGNQSDIVRSLLAFARCYSTPPLQQNKDKFYYYKNKEKEYYLKALQATERPLNLQLKAKVLLKLGENYYNDNDYSLALDFYHKSMGIYLKLKKNDDAIEAQEKIAFIYLRLHDWKKTLSSFQQALTLSEQSKNNNRIAKNLLHIAFAYKELKEYETALKCVDRAMKIYEHFKNTDGILDCYNGYTGIFKAKKDYHNALNLLKKGLLLCDSLKIIRMVAIYNVNIGDIYLLIGQYDNAVSCFLKSNEYHLSINQSESIIFNFLSIAKAYYKAGNYAKYQEYKIIFNETYFKYYGKSSTSIKNLAYYLCEFYLEVGNGNEAKKNALIYLDHTKKNFNDDRKSKIFLLKKCYEYLYKSDSVIRNFEGSLEMYKTYTAYVDSFKEFDRKEELVKKESRYQFEKEADEAKRKEDEAQRLADLETERRNNLQYLSIFAGLLVLFGGLAFMGRFRIPVRVLDIALFAALLILFEFLLILFDPILDQYTGGIPIQKLVFNSVIALGFAPLHGFLEGKLRKRFVLEQNQPPPAQT